MLEQKCFFSTPDMVHLVNNITTSILADIKYFSIQYQYPQSQMIYPLEYICWLWPL